MRAVHTACRQATSSPERTSMPSAAEESDTGTAEAPEIKARGRAGQAAARACSRDGCSHRAVDHGGAHGVVRLRVIAMGWRDVHRLQRGVRRQDRGGPPGRRRQCRTPGRPHHLGRVSASARSGQYRARALRRAALHRPLPGGLPGLALLKASRRAVRSR